LLSSSIVVKKFLACSKVVKPRLTVREGFAEEQETPLCG
jgi:hypothetical protein